MSGFNLGSIFAVLGLDASGFEEGLNNAQKALNNASKQMTRVGKTLSVAITAPLVAAGTASIKLASDFQSSMTKIETLVGLAGDTVQQMSGEVLGLSNTTGRASNELAQALFTITSAGQRGAEAMDILESSAKASAIGLGETNAIAKTVTSVLNAYGKENISAAKATDQLLAIVREGNLEASELAPTLGRVIGIGSQLGISFSELGANIATFTRLGVDSTEAVTGLRGIMNALIKPSEEGRKELAKMGMTFAELRKEVKEKGLAAVLVNLTKTFKGNEEALARLFPDIQGLTAVLGTAARQGENYVQIAHSIENATGLVDSGFKRVSQDSAFQFKQALEELKNVGIQIGNLLIPAFTKVLNVVRGVVSWFARLDNSTQTVIVTIGALVASLGPALVVLGTIGTVLSGLSLPIVGVVAGIAALAAGIIYVADNWEAIKERISDWSWWRNAIIDMIQFWIEYNPFGLIAEGYQQLAGLFDIDIRNPFEDMADALDLLKGETKEYEHEFGSFGDAVANAVDKAKAALSGLGSSLGIGSGAGGGSAPLPIVQKVEEAAATVQSATSNIQQAIADFTLQDVNTKLGEYTENIKTHMYELVAVAQVTGDQLSGLAAGGISAFAEAVGGLIGSGGDFKGFLQTILMAVVDFAKQFGQMLIAAGTASLAFENLLLNPVAAIAAGAALVAISGAIKGLLNKGPGGGEGADLPEPARMASGGVVPPGFNNDTYPALLSTDEMVIPSPRALPNGLGLGGELSTKISLRQLVIELDKERNRKNR